MVSGVTGIVSGAVGLAGAATTASDAVEVAAGVLASWLGISALFTHSEVEFRHDRNILQDVWKDPQDPQIFSPIVWRYLHSSPGFDAKTPREEILNAWQQKGRLGEHNSKDARKRRDLFFGSGGRYAAPELRARASMLETLEASLRLMHEELEILVREIVQRDLEGG